MQVDIIIVNWIAGHQLWRCLRSIERHGRELEGKVVVVDNASTDTSLDYALTVDLPVHVIRNNDNLGFARACNQGAAVCDAPYLLFLNPDTELYDVSLEVPLEFMENNAHKDVGICGIQLIDEHGNVPKTCARFPSLARFIARILGLNRIPGLKGTGVHMKEWDHQSNRLVDQVIGAFFLVRRKLFEDLEGFDERFFVYFEEVDFSKRARSLGWKTWYLADARAFHAGGGTSKQVKTQRLFYSLRSRLLYAFKHFPRWQAMILVVFTILVEPCTRVLFCLLRFDFQGIKNTLSGYKMLWHSLPDIFDNRPKNSK